MRIPPWLVPVLALLSPALAPAADPVLPAPNLAPQHLVHLTPPPDSPDVARPGRWHLSLDGAYASVFVHETHGADSVLYDMEVGRLALRGSRGLAPGLEVGLELPYLWRGPGLFDGLLSAYHDALGLPNGNRGDVGGREFHDELAAGGRTRDARAGAGLGDVASWLKVSLPGGGPLRWAGRGTVKLPTGDPDRGLGSGRADAAVGLLWAAEAGPLRLAGTADAVYVGGTPDPALSLGTPWAAAATLGAGATLGGAADAVVQLSYFASPYATRLSDVDRDVVMLAVGLRATLGRDLALTLGFVEDLATHASPDFGVFLSLEHSP